MKSVFVPTLACLAFRQTVLLAASTGCWILFTADSQAEIVYHIAFDDPGNVYASYHPELAATELAAANEWASHFVTVGTVNLDVVIQITNDTARGTGRSVGSSFVDVENGIHIYEQAAAARVRGVDVSDSGSEILVQINPSYLASQLWFESNPAARSGPVPNNRIDGYTFFLHEMAHAFAFNGWRGQYDASIPSDPSGPYESTFDRWESYDGSHIWFNGPAAVQVYGGPVPITTGDQFHFGNIFGPGTDLINDLMYGPYWHFGQRYYITNLDLAVMKDAGLPVRAIPEPSSIALVGFGFAILIAWGMGRGEVSRLPEASRLANPGSVRG